MGARRHQADKFFEQQCTSEPWKVDNGCGTTVPLDAPNYTECASTRLKVWRHRVLRRAMPCDVDTRPIALLEHESRVLLALAILRPSGAIILGINV